jgi:polar amino acid transport system substrate-binding protein
VSQGSEPTGREPGLVEGFADHLGVEIEWTVGGEEQLVTLLEEGQLDIAVGGVTDKNLWVDKVGLTRPTQRWSPGGRPRST